MNQPKFHEILPLKSLVKFFSPSPSTSPSPSVPAGQPLNSPASSTTGNLNGNSTETHSPTGPPSNSPSPSPKPVPVVGDRSTYFLHNKKVEAMSFEDLNKLPNADPKIRSDMLSARGFLTDVTRYKTKVPNRSYVGCPNSTVKQSFVDELEQAGSVSRIPRQDVEGHVNFFTVAEDFKTRFRPIRETKDINDTFGPESLLGITFPRKSDIIDLVHEGSHAAAFDFSAYYDQFKYDPAVSKFLCFKKGNKFYQQNRLCMGQRQGCDIGQSTTLFLLDFEGRRCKTYAYIDNVIFVGSQDDVLHDSKIFIERCKKANVTVNESGEINKFGIEHFVATSLDWCGISLDFTAKTVKLINKTVTKVNMSWSNRTNWTYRQFAAHIGLLFWSYGITDIPIHNYYSLLKYISHVSTITQANDSLWDQPCAIFPSAMPALQQWTDLCLSNLPRGVKTSSAPAWYVCTDASAWGWGYRAFNYATGEIRRFGKRWSATDKSTLFSIADGHKRSVYAEPRAVVYALTHLFDASCPASAVNFVDAAKDLLPEGTAETERLKICVATDNTATLHTFNKGFATRSFDINRTIQDLKHRFPDSHFDIDVSFAPGRINPGDKPSRGLSDDVNAITGQNYDDEHLRRLADRNFARSFNSTFTRLSG